ncbi:hypothetical protein M413DRAFT_32231 [Hebeloma cylindrosporum]|uniref:F-box domain-containing protein n=1 Tax=Hebeloma cylindrosporum TaxID=76867 RepID=A0A0C2Y3W7_HEBCY|nr:hypothetical protein M413DRAFT_32231 [Hebeloma cylindrosporum h7]
MSCPPTLPFETIETIIDILSEQDPGLSSLKSCSLVCEIFLQLCRKHIFASIAIDGENLALSKPTSAALVRLLSSTPEIAHHIRKLEWNIVVEEFEDRSLPSILKKITRLESLMIGWPWMECKWRKNRLRSAILHLLHLPTLIRLEISRIHDFAFPDLIPCTNLREFSLRSTRSVETEHTSLPMLPHKPLKLQSLIFGVRCSTPMSMIGTSLRGDGRPIFDLAAVASVKLVLDQYNEFEASRNVFNHCSQLVNVDISVNYPPIAWTGIAKMLEPSIETLTHLRFAMGTKDETGTGDPLAGLVAELEELRCHRNVVENMTIDVFVGAYYKCNQGEDWGLLDRVLTQPGWSKLRHISLTIFLWVCYREDDLEVTLKRLPETQLPTLSSSRSINFQFSVIDKSYDGYSY